jgi:hypothetical protein
MKKNNEKDSYCHYSDLPSHMAYVPKNKEKNIKNMNKWYNYGKWRHPEKRNQLMKDMNKEQAKDELIELLTNQVVDLTMMSKIELGDDVIAEIKRLKDIINEK